MKEILKKVPVSFRHVTLKNYFGYLEILNNYRFESVIDQDIFLLSYLTNEPEAFFKNLDFPDLRQFLFRLSLLKKFDASKVKAKKLIRVNGIWYKPSVSPNKLSYLQLREFGKLNERVDISKGSVYLTQSWLGIIFKPFSFISQTEGKTRFFHSEFIPNTATETGVELLHYATVGQVMGVINSFAKAEEKRKEHLLKIHELYREYDLDELQNIENDLKVNGITPQAEQLLDKLQITKDGIVNLK